MTGKKTLKGTADPVHAMDAYGRSRGTAPLILNLGTRGMLSGLTPRPGRLTAEEKDPSPSRNPLNSGWVGGS
jgi:hypothetical protein